MTASITLTNICLERIYFFDISNNIFKILVMFGRKKVMSVL